MKQDATKLEDLVSDDVELEDCGEMIGVDKYLGGLKPVLTDDLFEYATDILSEMVQKSKGTPAKVEFVIRHTPIEWEEMKLPWTVHVNVQEGILTEDGVQYRDACSHSGSGVDINSALMNCLLNISKYIKDMQYVAKRIDTILPNSEQEAKEQGALQNLWPEEPQHIV